MAQFIPVYGALTGGGTGALDAIYAGGESGYYNALATGDIAIVHNSGNNQLYVYRFNIAGSAYTESSPTIIKPDNQRSGTAYTGNGAWLLVNIKQANHCFLAVATAASNVTGDGTNHYPIVYGTETFDSDGDYDNTYGRYVAPVTGYYHFDASVFVGGITSAHTGIQLGLIVLNSSNSATNVYWHNILNAYTCSFNGALLLHCGMDIYLAANERMCAGLMCYGTSKVVDITASHGTFSGHLKGV